jgi:hypothetical protein
VLLHVHGGVGGVEQSGDGVPHGAGRLRGEDGGGARRRRHGADGETAQGEAAARGSSRGGRQRNKGRARPCRVVFEQRRPGAHGQGLCRRRRDGGREAAAAARRRRGSGGRVATRGGCASVGGGSADALGDGLVRLSSGRREEETQD